MKRLLRSPAALSQSLSLYHMLQTPMSIQPDLITTMPLVPSKCVTTSRCPSMDPQQCTAKTNPVPKEYVAIICMPLSLRPLYAGQTVCCRCCADHPAVYESTRSAVCSCRGSSSKTQHLRMTCCHVLVMDTLPVCRWVQCNPRDNQRGPGEGFLAT